MAYLKNSDSDLDIDNLQVDDEQKFNEDQQFEDDEEEEDDEQVDSEEEKVYHRNKQQLGDREPIYLVDQIHEKMEDFAWSSELPWIERQVIDFKDNIKVDKVDDDIQRELAFYNQALDSSIQAIQKFQSLQIAWKRPADYYAEMVKSDQHMNKVKQQLEYQQKLIEEAEQRRKQKEMKKYQKQIHSEKLKEKASEKKQNVQAIQKLRKTREKQGFKGEMDFDKAINKAGQKQQQQKRPVNAGMKSKLGHQKNLKRTHKDAKYGFGGRKRNQKRNDANSTADTNTYKPASFRESFRDKKQNKNKGQSNNKSTNFNQKQKQKVQKRPGKVKRQQMRQGK